MKKNLLWAALLMGLTTLSHGQSHESYIAAEPVFLYSDEVIIGKVMDEATYQRYNPETKMYESGYDDPYMPRTFIVFGYTNYNRVIVDRYLIPGGRHGKWLLSPENYVIYFTSDGSKIIEVKLGGRLYRLCGSTQSFPLEGD